MISSTVFHMISVFHCKINAVKQPTSLQLQTLPGGHYYGLLTLPKKRRKKATRAKIKKMKKERKKTETNY